MFVVYGRFDFLFCLILSWFSFGWLVFYWSFSIWEFGDSFWVALGTVYFWEFVVVLALLSWILLVYLCHGNILFPYQICKRTFMGVAVLFGSCFLSELGIYHFGPCFFHCLSSEVRSEPYWFACKCDVMFLSSNF